MPNPISRPSLNKSLEQRYNESTTGNSGDARLKVGKVFDDFLTNDFADGFTKGGQNTNFPKKESALLQGFSNVKYKG